MGRRFYTNVFDTLDPETGEPRKKPSHYHCRHCGHEEELPETAAGGEA